MRGKWLLFAGVAILAAVAAGALSLLWRKPAAGPVAAPNPDSAEIAAGEISLPGTIVPREVVAVVAPIEGTLDAFLVEEGEEVSEGQLLAQIKNTGIESERDQAAVEQERMQARVNSLESRLIGLRLEATRARAEANRAREALDRAQKAFLRQQFLYGEGATPRLKFEQAQREYDSAKTEHGNLEEVARLAEEHVGGLARQLDSDKQLLAEKTRELEEAGARIASGQVLAPVTGLVYSLRVRPGDPIRAEAQEIIEIAVNLALLDVVLEPAPNVLPLVRAGQHAVIHVAEAPGGGIPGTVREAKGGQVFVEFASPNPAVKPGLTAQVIIKLT
jgi:multidrug resistance efflux pump